MFFNFRDRDEGETKYNYVGYTSFKGKRTYKAFLKGVAYEDGDKDGDGHPPAVNPVGKGGNESKVVKKRKLC